MKGRDTLKGGLLLALAAWCALAGLVAGCDDEESNQKCESGCARDYASAVDGCEEQTAGCMAGCASPDDTSCMWDCEEFEDECTWELSMCMYGCPCLEDSQSCIMGCGQDDMECWTACGDEYVDCAGADSPYNCVNLCTPQKSGCVWDCEDSAVDMDEYLACRADCHAELTDCLADCG